MGVRGLARVPDVPAPPKPGGKALLAVTVQAWEAFWSSPALAGLVQPADLAALHRLFVLYDDRERMERAYRAQPFTAGSTGQMVVNPAAREIASMDPRISQLEDRFGLTPMARLKLGLTFGEAQRSLDAINREFDADDDEAEDEEEDPRLRVIDV